MLTLLGLHVNTTMIAGPAKTAWPYEAQKKLNIPNILSL